MIASGDRRLPRASRNPRDVLIARAKGGYWLLCSLVENPGVEPGAEVDKPSLAIVLHEWVVVSKMETTTMCALLLRSFPLGGFEAFVDEVTDDLAL